MAPIAKPKVLIIVGPTASGKTALSLEIARFIPSEIISADSRQVYRHLDIGTAKPTRSELSMVKHHCIDIKDPDEKFTAGDFQMLGREAISEISKRDIMPIVCGGTGLYVRAVVDGIFHQPDFSGEIRKQLENRLDSEGKEGLFEELKIIDPGAAKTMDATKYRRVIRALEVYYETGIRISQFHANQQKDDRYSTHWIGLDWERSKLYARINARVEAMLEHGFLDEVRKLLGMGYDDRFQALQTVGYREALQYLRNEIPHEKMIELMKQNTRRFAKRQLTWFRKETRVQWHSISDQSDITQLAARISASINS